MLRRRQPIVSCSFLEWFRFELHFAFDGLYTERDGVDVIARPDDFALLLDHLSELLDRYRRALAEFRVLLLQLIVKFAYFVSVRARRHLYIRFAIRRRYARRRRSRLLGGGGRGGRARSGSGPAAGRGGNLLPARP